MNTAAMHNDHCLMRRISVSQQIWSAFVVACTIMGYIGVVYTIKSREIIAFKNAKTVDIFSQVLTMSNSSIVILDKDGVVLKSNDTADMLFANGANIEGRNIHDFCLTAESAEKGKLGLTKFYEQSKPGAKIVVAVTADLPEGETDLVITATTVAPTLGNNTAIVAIVSKASRVVFADLREHPMTELRALPR